MSKEKEWLLKSLGAEAVKALKKNGFDAELLSERSEVLPKLRKLVSSNSTVGFGGSRTLEETGVFEWLRGGDFKLLDRSKPGISKEERERLQKQALTADLFFAGVNAVGLDGVLVFIDGYGNRVAPILYGPDRVILICGANKIASDRDAALRRAKEIAAPLNAYRLNRAIPCVQTGHCANCQSAERICNYTVILDKSPYPGRIKVFIVCEELGL